MSAHAASRDPVVGSHRSAGAPVAPSVTQGLEVPALSSQQWRNDVACNGLSAPTPGLSFRATREAFVTPTETNVHGGALCFMVKRAGWRLAVGGWRLAVGGWRSPGSVHYKNNDWAS